MSQRKILFFVIVGVVLISIVIAVNLISKKNVKVEIPSSLTIWINDGTTESYKGIIDGFKSYAPEYAKMNIVFEKKTSDPSQYRTLLLNTFADGKGPDIFMLHKWEDIVLEGKIEPIPWSLLSIQDFEKKYDDIFRPLIVQSWSIEDGKEYLMGVPMGYETLGIFYNKWLLRTVPRTWNELDALYNDWLGNGKFPSNLGLAPRYTPNMSDIIGLLLWNRNMTSYKDILSAGTTFRSYTEYGTASVGIDKNSSDPYTSRISLTNTIDQMNSEKTTTFDMFMRGEIGMIFWYPSTVSELEKAQKRAWTLAVNDVILTERIPKDSTWGKKKNLAKYSYFWVSKTSKNGIAAAKFLEYLMTSDAMQKFLKEYPYLISAQREFHPSQANNRLSDVLARTRLDAFIPEFDEELINFDYWLKPEFDNFLDKYIDRNSSSDINNIWIDLYSSVNCAVAPYTENPIPRDCERENG